MSASMILYPSLLPHPQCGPPPPLARAFIWLIIVVGLGCAFHGAWVVLKHATIVTCKVLRGLCDGLLFLLDERPR